MVKDASAMEHQMMGYDRAITMFSPDGRLLQVEYARKTVKQGSTVVGMICKDGALLVADKRIVDKLVVPKSVEKIFQIDDHIGAAASGIISDARVLIERAQLKAQQNRITYDCAIDTSTIVKDICSLKQICTQSGGLRPFGVAILVIGVDEEGPRLYETDPAGIYFQYMATAIGENETEIEEILHKDYRADMNMSEGLKLSLRALKNVVENFDVDRVDAAFIGSANKKFRRFTKEEIEKAFGDMGKESKDSGKGKK